MSQAQIEQLQLDYEGRIGSLLAVDDHVKTLVGTLRRPRQLQNTLIVFLSDNGWLQGQHRVTGDKFLPYEESLRIPLIVRGPGVPAGKTVQGPGRQHRLRADAARRRQRERGPQDGRRLAAADDPQPAQAAQARHPDRGAGAAVRGRHPGQRVGPALQGRAHRPLHLRRLHGDRRAGAVRPPQGPVPAAQRRRQPGVRARSRPSWPHSWRSWTAARAARASSSREGRRGPGCSIGRGGLRVTGVGGVARRPPRRALLRDHRAQGAPPNATRHRLEHDRAEQAARPPGGTPSTPASWRRSWAPRSSC